MRYRKAGQGLPKWIVCSPPEVDAEDVYPENERAELRQFDDRRMVIDQSVFNWIDLGIGLLLFFGMPVRRVIEEYGPADIATARPDQQTTLWIFFWIILFGVSLLKLIGLFIVLKSTLKYRKVFIFDRENGTVTYPGLLWFTRRTLPFRDACFMEGRLGPYGGESTHLFLVRADGITRVCVSWDEPEKFFAFLVWYMDRNRPLPPGSAFDPYREQDYQRRKREGFPPPLYPAQIATSDIDGADRYPAGGPFETKKRKRSARTVKTKK